MHRYHENVIRFFGILYGMFLVITVFPGPILIGQSTPKDGGLLFYLYVTGCIISELTLFAPWENVNSRHASLLLLLGIVTATIVYMLNLFVMFLFGFEFISTLVFVFFAIVLFAHVSIARSKFRHGALVPAT